MERKEIVDIVIVGASFAGLVAARTAAMRGLKVVVLEAKPHAGARVHTTGILVKEAADELDVPSHVTRKIRGVRLYAPRGRSMDLHAPGYYFLATDTAALLHWLAREAIRAGAELRFLAPFTGATREDGLIAIEGQALRARYLVGADGARSAVAKAFRLGENRHFLVGLEAEYAPVETLDQRFLHCFLDSRLAPGYLAWAIPGVSATQIGLASVRPLKPDLKGFLGRLEPMLGPLGDVQERRSGLIPCGGRVDPIGAPGVLLTGDAAGLVSPLTGGGIRLAFHYGRRVGQAVAEHLQDRGPDPVAVMAREYPRFGLKMAMRAALSVAPSNPLLDLALGTPVMRDLASRVYFHRRGQPGADPFDDLLPPEITAEREARERARRTLGLLA